MVAGSILRSPPACVLAFLFAIAPTVSIRAATTPDLSGKWRMNRELSEDAGKKLENALRSAGTVARRGGRLAPNQDARDRERDLPRRRIEALIKASESLDIRQGKKEVSVTEGDLRERKFYTDGRPYQRQDQSGNLVTMRARWRGKRLVVDTRLADGGRFTESYELAPGGRQLIVTVTSQDRRLRQPLVIRCRGGTRLTLTEFSLLNQSPRHT